MQHYCSVTLQFHSGHRKFLSQKYKFCLENLFLSDLVMKLLSLFAFDRISWKISLDWSFRRIVGCNLEKAQTSAICILFNRVFSQVSYDGDTRNYDEYQDTRWRAGGFSLNLILVFQLVGGAKSLRIWSSTVWWILGGETEIFSCFRNSNPNRILK